MNSNYSFRVNALRLLVPGFLGVFILGFSLAVGAADSEAQVFGPSELSGEVTLVGWSSEEGIERMKRIDPESDFYRLAHHYAPQINGSYCGVASSTIALNAINMPLGVAPKLAAVEGRRPAIWGGARSSFPGYSQITILNEETDAIKPRSVILGQEKWERTDGKIGRDAGFMLQQLADLYEHYGMTAEVNHADSDSEEAVDKFRTKLKEVVSQPDKVMIANFVGREMGAPTGGHISPLAAYDEQTDSVLILDVAAHRNPWYWAPVEELYGAMNTIDINLYRGYVIMGKKSEGSEDSPEKKNETE